MKKVLLTLLFLLSMLCTFAQREETIKLPSGQEVIVKLFDDDELSILGPVDKNISGVLDFTLQTYRIAWFHDNAFKDCSNITEVKINVKEFGCIFRSAFENCSSLKKVSIQAEIGKINIGSKAFYNCSSLEEVHFSIATIPVPDVYTDENRFIGERAFEKCRKLKAINLEEIKKIDNAAFGDCSSLESINLQSIIELRVNAFCGCSNLTTVKLPNHYIELDYIPPFHNCFKLSNETKRNMISWAQKYCPPKKKTPCYLSFIDSRGIYITLVIPSQKRCEVKINNSRYYGTWEYSGDYFWIDFDPSDCPTIAFNGSVAKRTRLYVSSNLKNIGVSAIATQSQNPKLTYRLATTLAF